MVAEAAKTIAHESNDSSDMVEVTKGLTHTQSNKQTNKLKQTQTNSCTVKQTQAISNNKAIRAIEQANKQNQTTKKH